MTKGTNVGLIGTEKINRNHIDNTAYRIPTVKPVPIFDILLATAKKWTTDCRILLVGNDHHPILVNNSGKASPIWFISNTHPQLVSEPSSPNSISFPPFYCWEQERPPAPNVTM